MSDIPDSEMPLGTTAQHQLILLRCLLENIPDRIFFKDRESRFICVSRAEAEYFRLPDPAEATGKTDFDFFDKELAQAAFDDEQRIMRTGKAIIGQVEKKKLLDGRTGWALISKILLKDASGQIIGTCGISKDITALKNAEDALHEANIELAGQKSQLEQALSELKAAQQQLIELENIQWIARLAFCVAHELRNPHNILNMGIEYLSSEPSVKANAASEEILARMKEALHRSDDVIAALMDGVVSSSLKIESSEIARTLELALKMMKSKGQPTAGKPPV